MMKRLIWVAGVASLALLGACNDGAGKTETDQAQTNAPAAAAAAAPAASATAEELARVTPAADAEARALTTQLLDEASNQMRRDNYVRVAEVADHHVQMGQGRNADWTVDLKAGQSYRIVGVCNIGCENVDMELRDASGAVVTSDVLADDVPIVEIAPTADAAYSARLIMKACETSPCLASARLFRRQ